VLLALRVQFVFHQVQTSYLTHAVCIFHVDYELFFVISFRMGGWRRLHNEDVRFTKYYYGDKIKEAGMGGACITYGRGEKCLQYFGWKT